MADDLLADAIRERLSGDWGRSLTVLERTPSTMDEASAAAAKGAPHGHVVIADQQSRGRGAHGRQWVSPPGSDLYFSIVARPEIELSETALVTLATGLGVRDAVAASLPDRQVLVKWPNDVWVARRKCAGILVESRTVGERIDSVIIGVGLNVNRLQWPPELQPIATSLRAERAGDEALDRTEVLAALLGRIERWVTRLSRDGAKPLVEALRQNLALLGEPVRWEDGRGVFEGIDPRGAAQVRTSAGLQTLHAAHIEPLTR